MQNKIHKVGITTKPAVKIALIQRQVIQKSKITQVDIS